MSRYGSHDPRAGYQTPNDPNRQEGDRRGGGGGLLSRHNQQGGPAQRPPAPRSAPRNPNRTNSRSRNEDASQRRGNGAPSRNVRENTPPPSPRQPSSNASRGRGRPAYEPYADAEWNKSWQWSNDPRTTESQAYPAAKNRQNWDASQQWPAGQWGESQQWGAANQFGESQEWNAGFQQDALGAGGARVATATKDDQPPQKKTWKQRLGLTRDAWQWEVLTVWPGVLRLVMAVMFAGGLVGLLAFTIRPVPVGGTPLGDGQALGQPGNGPIPQATYSLFGNRGPTDYQPPTATPDPTNTAGKTATTGSNSAFSAQPAVLTTTCGSGTTASTNLVNTTASPITYKIVITDGNGAQTPMVTAQPSSGTAQPGQTAVIFDASSACAIANTQHTSQAYTATVTWSTGGNGNGNGNGGGNNTASSGNATITDTVEPAASTQQQPTATPTRTAGGPGATPTPCPTGLVCP